MTRDPAHVGEGRASSRPTEVVERASTPWARDDGRLFRPEMLMIGATGRNAGKTELACRLIRRFASQAPIAALKVTAVEHTDGRCPRGGAGCGACSSLSQPWCVTRELDADTDKDTSKLLASGAREAYWLRVTREALDEGAANLLAHVPVGWPTLCESNSLSRVVEPGLFLQVRTASERTTKPSARAVANLVDRVVVSDGSGFDLPLERIALLDGQWALRREACAVVVMADTPPAPSVLASLRAQFTQVEVASVPSRDRGHRGLLRALAIALGRSAHDWCLVVRTGGAPIPAGAINAMFRRRAGAEAIVARGPSPHASDTGVLAHRGLVPRVAAALRGTASPAPSLSAIAKVTELPLARPLPAGDSERS